eukprot:3009758-Amphidinium_carterae.1
MEVRLPFVPVVVRHSSYSTHLLQPKTKGHTASISDGPVASCALPFLPCLLLPRSRVNANSGGSGSSRTA